MANNEKKFYEAMESIFTGAKIEGDGGFVNLLHIKSNYYRTVLEEFKADVAAEALITGDFKDEFFDRLHSFFSRYFSESGSVYFVKSAAWQKEYEKVYTDNKDVVLFWKTNMLYYVKSDILFQNMDLVVTDDNGDEFKFFFDISELKSKANNEKKELIYAFDKLEGTGADQKNFIKVDYKSGNTKTKFDEIKNQINVPEEIIEKTTKQFEKQASVDFFINKNAKKFLTEQLDLYLHQILLDTDNQFNQTKLDQMKVIKEFSIKIINFVSQFEDELVRIWNKPKFVKNSNYVISLDRISDKIVNKITTSDGLAEQINEWKMLKMVDDNFDFTRREEKHAHLPIDTKYFKELELEIIGQFDDLDESLNGRLIHSENYQALNTIQKKYEEKVQCIYIDPPFNTGSDFAYEDGYQDSTWLSIMNDRITLGKTLLNKTGSYFLHLDENANHYGRILGDMSFKLRNELIWNKGFRGTESKEMFQHAHDTIFYYNNPNEYIWNQMTEEYKDPDLGRYNKIDEEGKKYALIKRTRTDGTVYYGKTYPKDGGKSANDVISWVPTMASTNSQRWDGHLTQKPEELLQIIIETTTNVGNIVFDYFSGSGTTVATAHKSNRKFLGIELGEQYNGSSLN